MHRLRDLKNLEHPNRNVLKSSFWVLKLNSEIEIIILLTLGNTEQLQSTSLVGSESHNFTNGFTDEFIFLGVAASFAALTFGLYRFYKRWKFLFLAVKRLHFIKNCHCHKKEGNGEGSYFEFFVLNEYLTSPNILGPNFFDFRVTISITSKI